ncbi:MAG: HAMP domain-containing sensor histidine kinase [Bacteroidota bacterium]|nr:HAMP domain-containing sensor histidine kinase [Bacteroidota bacterium]
MAVCIVCASIFFTNILVRKIASDERQKIKTWAGAVQERARLIILTETFFRKIQIEERKQVSTLAIAFRKMNDPNINETDLNYNIEIISQNTTIPVIQTDEYNNIKYFKNINLKPGTKKLEGDLLKEFTVNSPIVVNWWINRNDYLYYKESKLFTDLKDNLNDLARGFFSEIAKNSASVPVIITDYSKQRVIETGNISTAHINEPKYQQQLIREMSAENEPIPIEINSGKQYVFYKDSWLLTQLRYYPIAMFIIMGVFLVVAYFLFSVARNAEQNQVWVGLAKETAHQLGTPLSSLMAWVELLKMQHKIQEETIIEMEKDVDRLQTVAERFSKIGSSAALAKNNITEIIYNTIDYLKTRTSQNVHYYILTPREVQIFAPINQQLFEWVIENLCRNAVDAMAGKGSITINITEEDKSVIIDVSDTGKGIPKSRFKTIFNPGYTSKQRGWGLGLSLSDRIITNYHSGKIFVKSSTLDKGTTFRIILRK